MLAGRVAVLHYCGGRNGSGSHTCQGTLARQGRHFGSLKEAAAVAEMETGRTRDKADFGSLREAETEAEMEMGRIRDKALWLGKDGISGASGGGSGGRNGNGSHT